MTVIHTTQLGLGNAVRPHVDERFAVCAYNHNPLALYEGDIEIKSPTLDAHLPYFAVTRLPSMDLEVCKATLKGVRKGTVKKVIVPNKTVMLGEVTSVHDRTQDNTSEGWRILARTPFFTT